MKLKVYAVRYKEDITPFVESYYSDPTVDHTSTSLTIINNYGELNSEINTVKLMFKYPNCNFTILDNVLRPDFSTGHLSRNWNQAIINGFKDLNNPDCDVVVCIQIDAALTSNWYSTVKSIFENKEYDYFSLGRGDEFQYFTPLSVKTIGLYDERYCNIGYQEADYFLRALLNSNRNKDLKISIGDVWHRRVYNLIEKSIIKSSWPCQTEDHVASANFHSVSVKVFHFKWGGMDSMFWNIDSILSNPNTTDTDIKKEFKYYPYFEKDINSDIYILE